MQIRRSILYLFYFLKKSSFILFQRNKRYLYAKEIDKGIFYAAMRKNADELSVLRNNAKNFQRYFQKFKDYILIKEISYSFVPFLKKYGIYYFVYILLYTFSDFY